MATQNFRWRIERLTLSGFRGFSKEASFPINGNSALIYGNNGTGKSTIAQGIQWILYGKFPPGVLANSQYDKFLSALSAGKKSYEGSLEFSCGKKRFVVRRDAQGGFTLQEGAKTLENQEAEERLGALLGLDGESFVRVALLHQSKIRGLLMDEARDRNAAMDKLLGTDSASDICAVLKPKAFTAAASEWRAAIKLREQEQKAKLDLLSEQLQEARERARSFGFLNKDFTMDGLESAYKSLWTSIEKLSAQHEVSIGTFPGCSTLSSASAAAQSVKEAISKVRKHSSVQNRLADAKVKSGGVQALKREWATGLKERDLAAASLAKFVKDHGTADSMTADLKKLRSETAKAKDRLKQANALRTLLSDASALLAATPMASCPVCESRLPDCQRTVQSLRHRANQLANEEVKAIEESIRQMQKSDQLIEQRVADLGSLDATVKKHQRTVGKLTEQIVNALSLTAASEKAIASKLDDAAKALNEKVEELTNSVEILEEGLAGVETRHASIREGLMMVIRKREEVAKAEKAGADLKKLHVEDSKRAELMDRRAVQIEEIRQALLLAREEVARNLLGTARPRAQHLYEVLVRHPLFDRLEIKTRKLAQKMDYSFEVSSSASTSSEREARLVLSDGQITAAALGLFFALAESASHNTDLLFIDDPTQNLDESAKEAMASVVVEIAGKKQVIISTHDEDFVSMLKSRGFSALGVIGLLAKWKNSPTLTIASPHGDKE